MVRTAILFFTQVVIFYFNFLVLLPNFLEKKKYLLYGLMVVALVITIMFILHLLEPLYIPDHILAERSKVFKGMPGEGRRLFRYGHLVLQGLAMFGTLFLSTIIRNVFERRKKEQERISLENKILEAESKMLKSQLNPHFLFNSLNNIYALSQMKSDKAPESIHRLSQMLRYVLYDCDVEKVSLKQEVEYIESYVQLQLLKDDNIKKVKVDLEGIDGKLQISPMLLISFIENCFKHSQFEDVTVNWIDIKINTEGNTLILIAKNSKPEGLHTKDKMGGVGLENVKRRLELAYMGKHELTINEDEKTYEVVLKLDLSEN